MPPTPSNRQAERNLLFAGLGLTLGILNRDKVIRAFTEWMLDKKLSLGDLLVEQKAITPEQKAVIEGAVEGQIEKEGGEEAALASLRNAKDLESDLDHLQDSDIQQSMVAVKAKQSLNPALPSMNSLDLDAYQTTLPEPPMPEAPSNDRFQRKAFLDAGALGEIWFAEDKELNRVVVVKYIKQAKAENPLNKALFHLEGEVTGHLEHPNIAPVYGLGKDQENRNFYAMRYIQGVKLTKAIRDYHQIPESQSGKRQETLIGLLQSFQSACLAIEFAHSRGIIHCDLKPDNIMVGQYGETLVIDWGLVLVREKKDLVPLDELSTVGPNEPVRISKVYKPSESASGGLHEKQGGIRNYVGGTPAYMSPEQFRATRGGDVDEVTPASDVFALGAVLFEILTNKAPLLPYKEIKENRQEYYDRIEKGNFPKPRSIKKDIPKALEAIVLKSMAPNPKDRYSSARDLADDVKRWISDEPVVAHKENFGEKSSRWMRKNRTIVAVLGMLLLSGMVGGLGFGLITQGYNNQLRISDGKIKDERDKAIENEKLAKKNEDKAILNEEIAIAQKKQTDKLLYISNITNALRAYNDLDANLTETLLKKCQWNFRDWEFDYIFTKANRKHIEFSGGEAKVSHIKYSQSGGFLFSGLENGDINVLDLKTGNIVNQLKGHTGRIARIITSYDDKKIASYSLDGSIKIWDVISGKNYHTFTNINTPITAICFGKKGNNLAIGNLDGSIKIFDITTGTQMISKKIHSDSIFSIDFSNDDSNLLTLGYDKVLRVFDLASGEIREVFHDHNGAITSFKLSPSGRFLSIGTNKGLIATYSFTSGKELNSITGHLGPVNYVSFSPDEKRFATCSHDKTIKLWDINKKSLIFSFFGHTGAVRSVRFFPDGNKLLSHSDDEIFKIWDLKKGSNIHGIGVPMTELSAFDISPNYNNFATAEQTSKIKINDINPDYSDYFLEGHKAAVFSAIFNEQRDVIASAGRDNSIIIWNPKNGKKLKTIEGHQGAIGTLNFCKDGTKILSSSLDGTVKIWDLNSGNCLNTLTHSSPVICAAYSPDNQFVASGSSSGEFKIWKSSNGLECHSISGFTNGISCMAFKDQSNIISVGSHDKTVKIINCETGKIISELNSHQYSVLAVGFIPKTNQIASGCYDGTIKIWDSDTGRELRTLSGHKSSLFSMCISKDGKYIVSGSNDKTLKLWNPQTGQELQTLKGHNGPIDTVKINPNGTRIASGSRDGTIKIWNIIDGQELLTLTGHKKTVTNLNFDASGKFIISCSEDNTVKIWDSSITQLIFPLNEKDKPILNANFINSTDTILLTPESGNSILIDSVTGQNFTSEKLLSIENKSQFSNNKMNQVIIEGGIAYFAPIANFPKEKERIMFFLKNLNDSIPELHKDQAAENEQSQSWFASVFHLKKLLELSPNDQDVKNRLQAAEAKLKEQNEKEEKELKQEQEKAKESKKAG